MDNQNEQLNHEKIIKNNTTEEKKNISDEILLQNKKIEAIQLELLQNKNKIHDILLRKLANIENIKKNTEIKIKKIKNTEIKNFFKKIIPIIDMLEDILVLSNTLNIKNQPVIQGIELTLHSLLSILCKSGVKTEGKKNDIFNPEVHESAMTEPSKEIKNNHIISIIKQGFTFNKFTLRKAIVTVSKN